MLLDTGFNSYVESGDELNVPHGSFPTQDVLGFLLKRTLNGNCRGETCKVLPQLPAEPCSGSGLATRTWPEPWVKPCPAPERCS